jgi:hypothetical protein
MVEGMEPTMLVMSEDTTKKLVMSEDTTKKDAKKYLGSTCSFHQDNTE